MFSNGLCTFEVIGCGCSHTSTRHIVFGRCLFFCFVDDLYDVLNTLRPYCAFVIVLIVAFATDRIYERKPLHQWFDVQVYVS